MIEALPKTHGDRLFSQTQEGLDYHREDFNRQRKRIASKLKNPRLRKITFHTLRHFKGTMEYHKTKDILHVMQTLGHKNIKNTEIYITVENSLFTPENSEYHATVAHSEQEETKLIEAGFEHVNNRGELALYRKRK